MNHSCRASRILGRLIFCGLLVTWATVPRSVLAETVLRWRFTAGQELQQTMTQKMTITMSINNREMRTEMNQTIDAVWKINAVDNEGTADMLQTIRRMRITVKGPGGGFELDTDSVEAGEGAAEAVAEALKKLVNADFRLKMNAQGEVIDVTIPAGVTEALQDLPGAEQLAETFSEEGMKNMITQGTPSLPKEGVTEGATWKREMSMKLPPAGTMNTVSTFTYMGIEGDDPPLHKLKVDLTQSIVPGEGGMKITLKDQQTQGSVYFDNEAGRMTGSEIKQVMTMEISLGGPTVEQKIDQTVKVSFAAAP
jgi:hypothetical protein